jgi:hypothetical protein
MRNYNFELSDHIPLTLSRQFLPEVCRVLVLDVFDNGVPAAVVVDQVAIAGSVNNVQAQSHAVLLDNVSDSLDLAGLSDGLLGRKTTLGLDKVRGEDGVDQSRLAETSLACRVNDQHVLLQCSPCLMPKPMRVCRIVMFPRAFPWDTCPAMEASGASSLSIPRHSHWLLPREIMY